MSFRLSGPKTIMSRIRVKRKEKLRKAVGQLRGVKSLMRQTPPEDLLLVASHSTQATLGRLRLGSVNTLPIGFLNLGYINF